MKHKALATLVTCYLENHWGFDGLRCLSLSFSHLCDAVEAQGCSSGGDNLASWSVSCSDEKKTRSK